MSGFPRPRLTSRGVARPGQVLPLVLSVDNGSDRPLAGGAVELTIEVEKGVLLSWNLPVPAVAAGGAVELDPATATPAFVLPLAVEPGSGRVRAVLTGPDGAYLGEAGGEVEVRPEEP